MKLMQIARSHPLILGMGKEGWSTYQFLRRLFPEMVLGIADRKPLRDFSPEQRDQLDSDPNLDLFMGDDYGVDVDRYDLMIKSPGISLSNSVEVQNGLLAGMRMTTPTNIFMANCPGRVIGVTGTKGKSTTATLIHRILEAGGRKSVLVGNIGYPALDVLDSLTNATLVVFEFSSYQLETCDVSPHIAVFVSFYSDHLDYHGGREAYLDAKSNISAHQGQTGTLVYNSRFLELRILGRFARGLAMPYGAEPGCRLTPDETEVIYGRPAERLFPVSIIPVPGRHNVENVMAAVTAGKLLEVPNSAIVRAIQSFKGLPHRLQTVRTLRGVEYVDDAISTTPECALEAMACYGKRLGGIIVGGKDRGYEFSMLAATLAHSPLQALVVMPESGARILELYRASSMVTDLPTPPLLETSDMNEAVRFLSRHVTDGRVALLSPGSPSYNLYSGFEERGEVFIKAVNALEPSLSATTQPD